jgi:phage-related protein
LKNYGWIPSEYSRHLFLPKSINRNSLADIQVYSDPTAFYAVKIGADIRVIHAFQKKSKSGIKTPQTEAGIICEQLKNLKEAVK